MVMTRAQLAVWKLPILIAVQGHLSKQIDNKNCCAEILRRDLFNKLPVEEEEEEIDHKKKTNFID